MALDANINRIKFLRSKTAGVVPTSAVLDEGELAINLVDRTIYSKNGTNVVELGFGKGGSVSGAITAPQFNGPLVGNASTATTLQTPRTINGTSFNGSVNITTANWGAPRTLTVGNIGKSVNGSANVSWSIDEIGAVNKSGDTMTGSLTINSDSSAIRFGNNADIGFIKQSGAPGKMIVGNSNPFEILKSSTPTIPDVIPTKTAETFPVLLSLSTSGVLTTAGGFDGNTATATRLQTPRTISLIGDGVGNTSFDGSSNTTINLTLNDVNNSAGTYGANQLEIPTFTLNKKGLLTSAGNRAFPYSGVGQYGAAILYDGLDSYSTSHSATANIVRHLNAVKVDTTSISRYKQDSDATRIYSPNLSKTIAITDTNVQVPDLMVSGRLFANGFASDHPYGFLTTSGQEQVVMTGGLLASNSYADQNKVHGLGIYAKGVIESVAGFKGRLLAKDSRTLKPLNAEAGGISAYFVTEWGLNNDYVGGNYGDFLSLNTYHDASPGMQNGLFFDKTGKRIVHYQSVFGGASWGSGKTLAYAEDVLSINGGTINGSLNVSDTITITGVGEHANAFKKLIQANTTSDGGYIAVGNHGGDKGYLELGTVDDPDAAIYARKRNAANTILEEAVILGSDGNTSFPKSVFIHNALGGYGKNGLVAGNGDNAVYGVCNIDITSWFGVGIKASNSGERTVVFNARTGDISNKGSINTVGVVNGKGLGVTSTDGTGAGLSLHNGAVGGMPNYGISFAQTSNFGAHGYVNGDWATYFTMAGAHNRGWIFRSFDYGNVASISAQGVITAPTFVGSLTGNAATATQLATARTINGVSFNGSANITVADDTKLPLAGGTITGNLTVTNITANGTIFASGNITAFSDRRLKENIKPIDNVIDRIKKLNGVTYTRNDLDDTNKVYTGLIAQDVQQAMPQSVVETDEGILSVDYPSLIGLLTETIKNLNSRIEKLENK